LADRRAAILASVEEQGKMTPELRASFERAETKAELEDLYRPYKPKRRTRATIAMERGLGPLAERIWGGTVSDADVVREAAAFVNPELEVPDVEAALAGARDILAERVADDAAARAFARDLTRERGELETAAAKGKAEETSKFQDYYAFSEPIRRIPGHRVLAIRRGETEGFLTARITRPRTRSWRVSRSASSRAARPPGRWSRWCADAYRRLISPSVEVELRTELKTAADEEAIRIFGQNLEGLLLASPAGGRITLGIDPGYRTGCKLAVVSRTGSLLATGVVYLHQEERARNELRALVERHGVELIAVGNGTASRETDRLAREMVKSLAERRGPRS
jgi:protein Tex